MRKPNTCQICFNTFKPGKSDYDCVDCYGACFMCVKWLVGHNSPKTLRDLLSLLWWNIKTYFSK